MGVSVALAAAPGCFPYAQTYRPALRGVIVDQAQHPVPGAQVVTCTAERWAGLSGCPRFAETYAGSDGRYALPELKEMEWCCFGEAPRPMTIITACAKSEDGRVIRAPSVAATGGEDQRLEVRPPEHPYPPTCMPRW